MKNIGLFLVGVVACAPERSNPLENERLTESAPQMLFERAITIAPEQTAVILIAAADIEQDAVTIEAVTLPEGATFDGRLMRFRPTLDMAGEAFSATFIAVDATGLEVIRSVTLEVEPACIDRDFDGFDGYHPLACPAGSDCNDQNPFVHPDAHEEVCDGVDNDCFAGTPDDPSPTDVDGDSFTIGCGDCDDNNDQRNPGMTEVTCDAVDNDCDPTTLDVPDEDGDLFSVCVDCDDTDPDRHPLAEEICDGVDNNCAGGTSDEICP